MTEAEKHIMMLSHEKQCFIDECWNDNGEIAAYDYAIRSIEKLEKIKGLLGEYGFIRSWEVMKKICEVMEE